MGARWEQFECGLALLKINWGIGMMAMAYYISLLGAPCGVAFFVFTMLITYLGVDRSCAPRTRSTATATTARPTPRSCGEKRQGAAYVRLPRRARPALRDAGLRAHLALQRVVVRRVRDLRRRQRRALRRRAALGLGAARGARCPARSSSATGSTRSGGATPRAWAWACSSAASSSAGAAAAWSLAAVAAALRRAAPAEAAANLPVAAGIAVFCNEGIVALAPSARRDMSRAGRRAFRAVVAKTLVAFTVFYMAVGLSGAALYADLVPSVIVFFLAFETAEGWCARRSGRDAREPAAEPRPRGPRRHRRRLRRRRRGRARFGDFLALTGSVSNAATIYVLPHLMFFRCVPGAPRGEGALLRERRLRRRLRRRRHGAEREGLFA
ncbi:metalloendopeptidase [Aureococcus anophagefferens]|nr:metalloendopeptidase [Aureococcus anophagefferens]